MLSFIEGACVMAAELLGAKMLAPYFGSSLYVWATVLAITLGGLAIGYFAGGELSYRSKNKFSLFYVLLIGSAFMIAMPFSSKFLLHYLQSSKLIPSLLFSGACFLLPPVIMMGMVSPLLIDSLSGDKKDAGRMAGTVYAISTVGGIVATFLLGFYVIPEFGLTLPAIIFGCLLALIPAYVLLKNKKFKLLILVSSVCIVLSSFHKPKAPSDIKTLYSAEGLLGQLLVVDYPVYEKSKIKYYSRILFCNRIIQTVSTPKDSLQPTLPYIQKITNELSALKKGSTVLLLGLGGGALANQLTTMGHQIDAVEFDNRMVAVAKKYFELNPDIDIENDDARHYLNACSKKYDVIIFDLFKGEENPNHVLTIESLNKAKMLLNPGGQLVLNGNGYLQGKIGRGMRSIYKTFNAAGFSVKTLTTGPDEAYRNALYFATLHRQNTLGEYIDTTDALVLLDEFPVLDILNKEANRAWRLGYIQNSIRNFEQRNVPIFD